MKRTIEKLAIALFLFLYLPVHSQSNIKKGNEAPPITITEWLLNRPADTDLQNKYIVLDFWATWCKPCLEAVPHINDLQQKFASPKVLFLSMTNESREVAQKVFDRVDFQTPVVTDENSQTHIHFGDGRKGLVYYPMTVLIDDNNKIRWYGSSDQLTEEMMEDFLNDREINVDQLSTKDPYSKKQDRERLTHSEWSLKKWSDMFHDPDIGWTVHIEEVRNPDVKKEPGVNMGNGAYYNLVSLEELCRSLFPRKKFVIPGDLSEKKYQFAYLDKELSTDSEQQLLQEMMDQLDLNMTTREIPGVAFQVKVKNRSSLVKSTTKGWEMYRHDDRGNLVFERYSIAGMLEVLSAQTDHQWTLKGKDRGKYTFTIAMASTGDIRKSLASYGLEVNDEAIRMETVYLSEKGK